MMIGAQLIVHAILCSSYLSAKLVRIFERRPERGCIRDGKTMEKRGSQVVELWCRSRSVLVGSVYERRWLRLLSRVIMQYGTPAKCKRFPYRCSVTANPCIAYLRVIIL